jgi:hypothetical protein
MNLELAAIEREVLNLLASFPGSSITEATVNAYLAAVEDFSAEAVKLACRRFVAGDVPGQNKAFRPSAAELVEQVRIFVSAIRIRDAGKEERAQLVSYPIGGEPPPPMKALGPVEVDFGGGRINMRDMTPSQKEEILANKGAPPANRKLPRDTLLPRLKRMGGEDG